MRFALLLACFAPLCAQQWETTTPAAAGLDADYLQQARDYALSGGGSGVVLRGGKLVYQWGDPDASYDLKSTSKSIGVTALGLALADGKLSLQTMAADCLADFATPPDANRRHAAKITLFHLAAQTAGFAKPGGFEPIEFEPGSAWSYSDGGPNWLADCLTATYGEDLQELLFERVFEPIGIARTSLRWRDHQYRPRTLDGVQRREFGSGVHANVRAMARLGELYLHQGRWEGKQLIPRDFVQMASKPIAAVQALPVRDEKRYPQASTHYGLLWWNNAAGANRDDDAIKGLPRDAFWSWGLYDSLIVVIPSLDLVVARAGKSFAGAEGWSADYERLKPFLRPLAYAVGSPYPPSLVITGVEWAPVDQIVRKAEGSDNWPTTWGRDDALYTAYGDGWGFEPKVEKKLSLGFVRVTGEPLDPRGENLRTETGERVGQGDKGLKASGLLMVDGVLYLWVRNAANSQLAWSEDRGKTWEWADWRLTHGFGAPAFLQFGPDYADARDDFVYAYSPDADSAYDSADGLALMRAPKQRLREKAAWEVFSKGGWSGDFSDREPVLHNPGRIYRTQVSYNAGLGRYLACVILPEEDTRFEGGFSVFDAPEPWGPWTTVEYIDRWDVGPGETCSFPTKWMSQDGRTVHMLFSGDDYFSVRRAVLEIP